MVDDGRLLRRDQRVVDRAMRCGDDAYLVGRGGDARGPGEGFKAGALWIELAAEPAPARHRQQCLELHLVGELGEGLGVRPGNFQPPLDVGHEAAIVEIALEGPELELAVVEGRIGQAPVLAHGDGAWHSAPPYYPRLARRLAPACRRRNARRRNFRQIKRLVRARSS